MHAVLIDPTTPEDLTYCAQFCPHVTLQAPVTGDPQELRVLLKGARALVSKRRLITAEMMDQAGPSLELLHLWSGRRDKVDMDAARARDLSVSLTTQIGCVAVAEMALTLMLGLSKKVIQAHDAVMHGRYRELGIEPVLTAERRHKFQWMALPGVFEVSGTQLGLIGMGEIATETARLARAFRMEVSYWNRRRLPLEIEQEEGLTYRELDDLLAHSDFVSIHTPHQPETDKLINAERLALMKSSACLINTARGGIVDEAALVEALRAGRLAGAGLDVFTYEPLPADSPLLTLEGVNVMFMPHLGGGSGGTREKQARDTMGNLERLAIGQPLRELRLATGVHER